MKSIVLLLLAVVGLSRAGLADVIVVPDDQPDLQAAIAAASAGDTVVVRTAADQNTGGNGVVLDKALTIVGDPLCEIQVFGFGGGLQLAGPGAGEVVLVGLSIRYSQVDSSGVPLLYGGGFDAVHLIDCAIRHDNAALTGLITTSHPAVDLPTVSELSVVDCDLLGGPAGSDACIPAGVYTNGREGIRAPVASVLLLDSRVIGGRGGVGNEFTFDPCPGDLATWGGRGGDAVVAAEVHSFNSTVTGGSGVTWQSYVSGLCDVGGTLACGTQPDGARFVVGGVLVEASCSRLTQPDPRISLGGAWTLDWDPSDPTCVPLGSNCPPGCLALLYAALAHPIDPVPLGTGWSFLDPSAALLLTTFPAASPFQLVLPVPPAVALLGLPVTAQAMLTTGEPSGPTAGLVTF